MHTNSRTHPLKYPKHYLLYIKPSYMIPTGISSRERITVDVSL